MQARETEGRMEHAYRQLSFFIAIFTHQAVVTGLVLTNYVLPSFSVTVTDQLLVDDVCSAN